MLALALAAVIVTGGLIDLAPVKNGGKIGLHLAGDRLFDWIVGETQPRDVFLTDIYVTHQILLAGARLLRLALLRLVGGLSD
jgi:hypothetical protein